MMALRHVRSHFRQVIKQLNYPLELSVYQSAQIQQAGFIPEELANPWIRIELCRNLLLMVAVLKLDDAHENLLALTHLEGIGEGSAPVLGPQVCRLVSYVVSRAVCFVKLCGFALDLQETVHVLLRHTVDIDC